MPRTPLSPTETDALLSYFEGRFAGQVFPALLLSLDGVCLAKNAALDRLTGACPIEIGQAVAAQLDEAQRAYLHDHLTTGRTDADGPMVIRWNQVGQMPIDLHLLRVEIPMPEGGTALATLAHAVAVVEKLSSMLPARKVSDLGEHPDAAHETEAERVMRTSLEVNNLALWSHCPATGESWHSDVWFLQLGYEAGDFDASLQNWMDLMHPDDLEGALGAFAALVDGRTDTYQADFRLRRKDGSWNWLSAQGARVDRSDAGLPYLVCGIQTDIMDRKRTEAELAEVAKAAMEARNRLDRIAANAPVGLFEFRMSVEGEVTFPYVSQSVMATLGVASEDVERDGNAVFQTVLPEFQETLHLGIAASMEALSAFNERYQIDHPKLGIRWINARSFPMRQADGATTWFGSIYDVTEEMQNEADLAEAARIATEHRNRLDHLADNAPGGLFELDVRQTGEIRFNYSSHPHQELIGATEAELMNDPLVSFRYVRECYHAEINRTLAEHSKALTPATLRFEIDHPERGLFWANVKAVPMRKPDGATTWFGFIHDATLDVQREAELQAARDDALEMKRQMEELAMHDALTGLPNRRKFDEILHERKARPKGVPMTLVRVDLDHFKFVNDNLGHDAGDAVLRYVAETLSHRVRGKDSVFRLGGDEFSILLAADGSVDTAKEIVRRIQEDLARPFLFEGQICRFGASFGIAVGETLEVTDAELNTFADVALYEAKARGRNRVEVFTDELHHHILDNRRLAAELEEAVDREEFIPYFQPQVSAQTGALVGLEALARWQHPTRGILSPDAFMTVSEQIRIVPQIDQMIFAKTRSVLKDWRERGFSPPKISFNVSSSRLQDPSVVTGAKALLDEGVVVGFELLESILAEEETDAFRFHLDALRDMGIEIEVDDFGSGHASIIGLMECNPSMLKIDRRLITPIEESLENRHLVAAIVGMARALGISVTVEGVETEAQACILREMQCDVFQGYLFSRPLAPDALFQFAHDLRHRAA